MRKYRVYIVSSIISILFITLTGLIIISNSLSVLYGFAFLFHLIPFGIGFTGGVTIWIYVYYFLLWVGLSFLLSPIVLAYYSSENKKRFLIFVISPLILLSIVAFYIDYASGKQREERIALQIKNDKIDFGQLRTGDLVFNKINGQTQVSTANDSTYIYNNIGVLFVDEENFVVIETADRVQYASLRQWIKKGLNNHYLVKRLINADSLLSIERAQLLRKVAQDNIFKETEKSNNWSDDKMYNSELVWKIYKNSLNVELGKLEIAQDSSSSKYVITTNSIFNSEKLTTISEK